MEIEKSNNPLRSKRKIYRILVVLVVLIASLGFLAKKYYFVPFNNPFIKVSTVSQIEGKNWKTFRNDEYGFEFSYPDGFNEGSSYKLEEDTYFNQFEGNIATLHITNTSVESSVEPARITIAIQENPTHENLSQWHTRETLRGDVRFINAHEVNSNGAVGLQYKVETLDKESYNWKKAWQTTTFINDRVRVTFYNMHYSEREEPMYDKVIPTFRFTRQ